MEVSAMFLTDWLIPYILEPMAVVAGLISIWFLKNEKLIGFPLGILNVFLYVFIFFVTRLYANAAINAYFFFMQIYGWYNWSATRSNGKVLAVTRTSRQEWLWIVPLIFLLFLIIRYVLVTFTEGQAPNLDAFTTAIYMIAQLMISRKKLENWTLWIVSDVIMVVLCLSQALWITSFQYAVFTIIAFLGYREWRLKMVNS
jgi:nicotinamide mononucleotide transporter